MKKTRKLKKIIAIGLALILNASTAFGGWIYNPAEDYWAYKVYGDEIPNYLDTWVNCHLTPDGYWCDEKGHYVEPVIKSEFINTKNKSISEAKYGRKTIFISKTAHVLELWDNGVLEKRYTITSGRNTSEDIKTKEGDCVTPVGEYYVCIKNPHSCCHKALGISYPNIQDAYRGLENGLISKPVYDIIESQQKNRIKPLWNTKLGGFVEIHGGRQPIDGSHGCVGMTDADIDDLYARVSIRDTIIILK